MLLFWLDSCVQPNLCWHTLLSNFAAIISEKNASIGMDDDTKGMKIEIAGQEAGETAVS